MPGLVHESEQARQPTRRHDDIIVQDGDHLAVARAHALIPGLCTTEIRVVRDDFALHGAQEPIRSVSGPVIHQH